MPRNRLHDVIDPDTAICPVSDWHTHMRIQLLYQAEGTGTLYTADRVGRLTPSQAVWLRAGRLHRTTMYGRFSHCSLYFDVVAYLDLPRSPVTLEINALLRELILRVTELQFDQTLTPAQDRLVATVLDELASADSAPLHLVMPREKRRRAIAQALPDDPASPLSPGDWGTQVVASERTLARSFVRETGTTFAQWRTQCRLLVAPTGLAEGVSVTTVAHMVGYGSNSAFIAMYCRLYGLSPGRKTRTKVPV
jgi:AraC-like DNA-binding protein